MVNAFEIPARRSRGGCARPSRSLAIVALLLLASALAAQDVGHEGPAFAGAGATPTESKPESKLWFNDGHWWGSLWSSSGSAFRIHRLDFAAHRWIDTGVEIDARPNSHGDALWDGTQLYIASHEFSTAGETGHPILVVRYSYDSTGDTYFLDPGFPVTIGDSSTEAVVIDKDSTGMVWAAWTEGLRVRISHTQGVDTSWRAPFVLPSNSTDLLQDDICSLIHFNGDRIGVLWSDQVTGHFRFSVHLDGAGDTEWSGPETAGTGVDDHINLAADSTGRVFVAAKTGLDEVLLLVREAPGWRSFVAWQPAPIHTRPIVLLDEQARRVHLFSTAQQTGEVFEKSSSLDAISFPAGEGQIVMRDGSAVFRISDPTSTKQNVSSSTGLVVLAHHDTTGSYWHHEVPPGGGGGGGGGSAPTADFTASTRSGQAPLTVSFTDASTGSVGSWSWSFGDGGTSSARNPTHTYSAPGSFTVSLTVSGSGGSDTETKAGFITVSRPPSNLVLARPVPGIAGVPNVLTVTGATPGSTVAFYSSSARGASIASSSGCPNGVPLGLQNPSRMGSASANLLGVAVFTVFVPITDTGKTFHYQAVDQSSCSASNVVTEQF